MPATGGFHGGKSKELQGKRLEMTGIYYEERCLDGKAGS
jgi:hypothetical protein